MTWYQKIMGCHKAVTNAVRHGHHMKSNRYFVWQEDGSNDLSADGIRGEKAVTGTTDLFTKQEFDPWKEAFEAAMDAEEDLVWSLNSVQFEEQTGFWHYEWTWEVLA